MDGVLSSSSDVHDVGPLPTTNEIEQSCRLLKSCTQYKLNNIISYLDLADGDNFRHGIFSATVSDTKHTLKSTIIKYVLETFFSLMTKREKACFDFVAHQVFCANHQTILC